MIICLFSCYRNGAKIAQSVKDYKFNNFGEMAEYWRGVAGFSVEFEPGQIIATAKDGKKYVYEQINAGDVLYRGTTIDKTSAADALLSVIFHEIKRTAPGVLEHKNEKHPERGTIAEQINRARAILASVAE